MSFLVVLGWEAWLIWEVPVFQCDEYGMSFLQYGVLLDYVKKKKKFHDPNNLCT